MEVALRADRERVRAFRLAAQHLTHRLPPGSLLAASAGGVEDYPPGSALVALGARVEGLAAGEVERALALDKSLVRLRSLRTAPHLIPTADVHVFTTGLAPTDEAELRFYILAAGQALDRVGISATELVERTNTALLAALDGRVLTFAKLSTELTERLRLHLSPEQRHIWQSASPFGANQSLGEALIHFALYACSLKGQLCFAPREGNEAAFLRTDQWLGRPLPTVDPALARAELVRRYLRAYGPSTPGHFARWAGIAPDAAQATWNLVASHLIAVDYTGRRTWLHLEDREALNSPPQPAGTRFLPPHDPYLADRDRATLLPKTALHRQVWRPIGRVGVVLHEGEIVAHWQPQKKGERLSITVTTFAPLDAAARAAVAAEAEKLAALRRCSLAALAFLG